MTQRFAAGSEVEAAFPSVHFRYVVASPSSYVYLSPERLAKASDDKFEVPSNPGCAYDDYRYGLQNRQGYIGHLSEQALRQQYLARDVVYLVGAQDDATSVPSVPLEHDPKDAADLDVSCPAEWQGDSRLSRSLVFKKYLDHLFPSNGHHFCSDWGCCSSVEDLRFGCRKEVGFRRLSKLAFPTKQSTLLRRPFFGSKALKL